MFRNAVTTATAARKWFGCATTVFAAAGTVSAVSKKDDLSREEKMKNENGGIATKFDSIYSHCEGIVSVSNAIYQNAPAVVSLASPVLPIRIIHPNNNPNIEIAYDVRTKTPIYVMETLTKESLQKKDGMGWGGGRRRRPNFYEEKYGIESPEYRSKVSQYHKSGYDRGHMCPSADFVDAESQKDTYSLCNIVPQNPTCNQGVWSTLEERIRKFIVSSSTTRNEQSSSMEYKYYVVTGPLWLPRNQIDESKFEYRYVGLGQPPSLISVPTHLFKVVVEIEFESPMSASSSRPQRPPTIRKFGCFVVGNEEQTCSSKRIEDYVVGWNKLETVTGLKFFANFIVDDHHNNGDAYGNEWKEHADRLTEQQVPTSRSSHSSRLYLADSKSTNSSKRSSEKIRRDEKPTLEHICANGYCK